MPERAPKKYSDRTVLWNAVEKIEKAKNSQLAREIELALPVELTLKQNISLVCDYVKTHFVSAGMCADVCIHDKADSNERQFICSSTRLRSNPHAHIMLTMRPFEPDGTWGSKQKKEYILDKNGEKIYDPKKKQYKCKSVQTTDWNEQTKAEEWRAAWAESVNKVLEQCGHESKVDHRSYERQGLEQIPTVHMGVAASQMERKGVVTERGNMNREIIVTNRQLQQLSNRINQIKDWLKEVSTSETPTTLANVLQCILQGGKQRNRYAQIQDMKTVERIFNFLKENNISTLLELRDKVSEMHTQLSYMQYNVKYAYQRADTLDERIRQAEIYVACKPLYAQFQQLRRRKQAKFYESHCDGLIRFDAAKRHLSSYLNGNELPIKAWKEELEELRAKYGKTRREYKTLQEQVWNVETICLDAQRIVRAMNPPPQRNPRLRDRDR